MNILKAILAWFGMVISGMWGGQRNKSVRRVGVPVIATIYGAVSGLGWRALAFLLWIPILAAGYGEHSILAGLLGNNDILVRLVYGFLVSIPFIVFGLWRWAFAGLALVIAYSIHAGKFGTVLGYDLLIEDAARFGTIASLVLFNVIKK